MNARNYYLIQLYKAFKATILSYLYGEPLLHSFLVAFYFRKVCNDTFVASVTPEQLEEVIKRRFSDDDCNSLN